jgi:hypothetical protein
VIDGNYRRRSSRKYDAAYIDRYEITIIEGPKLVFIPKFEVEGKECVRDKSARRGQSIKLEAEYIGSYEISRKRERTKNSFRNLR